MNFFSDENRNNYNFNKNANIFKDPYAPKKRYRCTCPLFSRIRKNCSQNSCSCNLTCCSNFSLPSCFSCSSCSNCSLCSKIRSFIKSRPYCFLIIIAGILLFIILIIIIAVAVKKSKKKTNFMEIYNNIGDNADGTLAEFCEYLSKEASDLREDQKVNLAYKWITENIKYDTEGVKAGTEERDPDKFFKSRKTVCSGYAHLMYKLLVSMNYDKDNIKNITGYAKGEGYSVYEVPKVSHEWNAIKIDGKWCLIDATWDAGNTDYMYFCTQPDCFVRDHLPEKPENQFLETPIDLNTFHSLTWTTGAFCQFNAKIVKDQSYYNACQGKFRITYENDYDKDLYINSDDSVTFEIKEVNKVFEVDFTVKNKGQFVLYMFMIDENFKGPLIGKVYIDCN